MAASNTPVKVSRDRPLAAMWLYLSLTLASALAAHLVFDAVDDGLAAVFTRPIHLLYLTVVVVLFVFACCELGRGVRADRLRRLAIARDTMRRMGPSPLVAACFLQAATACGTLVLEGAAFDGIRLALAVAATAVALFVGALALRQVECRILRLVEAVFVSPLAQRPPRRRNATDVYVHAASAWLYFLFAPKRPPPLLV
jgi:hypothetical protein